MNGQALLSAVLASLWLGALLAPAALLVTRAWPRLAARDRHTLWWVVWTPRQDYSLRSE